MSSEQQRQIVPANPAHVEPEPGSIQYARKVLAAKRLQSQSQDDLRRLEGSRRRKGLSKQELIAEKVPPLFFTESPFWRFLAFLGPASTQVLCHAAKYSFGYQQDAARSSSNVAHMFLFRGLAHMSNRALEQFVKLARPKISKCHITELGVQGSAALLDAAALLWAGMFGVLKHKMHSGELIPLVFVRRSRYDETPLKVRLCDWSEVEGHRHQQSAEVSTHAKVLQTECAFQCLFEDHATKRVWSLEGYLPTHLKAMDATTAENIKGAILMDVDRVHGWKDFAECFPWVLQSTTVDRYAANFKAEKSILADTVDPATETQRWSKHTKSCDVHVIAQVHHKTMSVLETDISGLLNTALSQHGSGTLNTLHDILRQIFNDETNIIYGLPPSGSIERHRRDVYDLYLPLPRQDEDMTVYNVNLLLKRHILSSLLNGDIEQEQIVHYCSFGCCADVEESISKLQRFGVYALLRSKQPRFARNRWNNQEEAVCWSGLFFGNVTSLVCHMGFYVQFV